ncbi:MAG: hypothetical protein FJX76_11845 [Armatimonadetes bacterium]|nr:hypothetical protein [Armatimonadota bacterium]
MEYYELLGLNREPFADTANPFFLYASEEHSDCLHRLEISVRLGRGLSMVLGDVGTGKTTMALALEKYLLRDPRFYLGVIYDPAFLSELEFMNHLLLVYGVPSPPHATVPQKMEALKEFLYRKGAEEGKSVVLILDEGQKVSPENLELVRLLLNFQVPQRRLFNVVIFGQLELLHAVESNTPLKDRINLLYIIRPLGREETHELIDFRLRQAGMGDNVELFTPGAKDLVFHATGGHPRKIVLLCQEAIEEAIIRNTDAVTDDLVNSILLKRGEIENFIKQFIQHQESRRPFFDRSEHAYVQSEEGQPGFHPGWDGSRVPDAPPEGHVALPNPSVWPPAERSNGKAVEKPPEKEPAATARPPAPVSRPAATPPRPAEPTASKGAAPPVSNRTEAKPPLRPPEKPVARFEATVGDPKADLVYANSAPQAPRPAARDAVATPAWGRGKPRAAQPNDEGSRPARRGFWQWLFGK